MTRRELQRLYALLGGFYETEDARGFDGDEDVRAQVSQVRQRVWEALLAVDAALLAVDVAGLRHDR